MSFTHVERASVKPPRIFWPLLGLFIVLAADGATALVLHTTAQWASISLPILYLAAPVAALLAGIPAWFYFIGTPRCATIRRGLLAGIVSSIIAHPILAMLLGILALFMPQTGHSPLFLLLFPQVTIFSLLSGGWATTPIGALAGVLLISLQRILMRCC